MGTRGFIGFVINGQEKIAYNHWDSYPSGLGVDVLKFLHVNEIDHLRPLAANLRVVTNETPPTDEEVGALAQYSDTSVSSGDIKEWYVLLRQTMGNPALMLDAGVIEDASEFPIDSLFAEWGYVIDFDANVFEVYEGFQHAPHRLGRFAHREATAHAAVGATYYPCALVASFPLNSLPSTKLFLATVNPKEDEDEDEDEDDED